MNRQSKYRLMSEQYIITHSNIVLNRILESFTIEEILEYEEDISILYQVIKRQPEYIVKANYQKPELAETIMCILLDEYKINVAITDKVLEFFNTIRVDEHVNLKDNLIELLNTAIKHMNEQGFEVVAYNLSHSDIRKMISVFLEPLKYLSVNNCLYLISSLMTRDNFTFIIEELEIMLDRDNIDRYTDYIIALTYAINLVKDLPEPEEDVEDEDFNPLTEPEKLSTEELYNIAFNYISCDINLMDRMEAFSFIHQISNVMLGISNSEYEDKDTTYRIIERIFRGLYKSINKTYGILCEDEPNLQNMLRVMNEIDHIDFRLPRIKFIVDGRYEIKRPLYKLNLQNEYDCVKDLETIEQLYDGWYIVKLELDMSEEIHELKFGVDLDTFRKLLPFEDEEYNII